MDKETLLLACFAAGKGQAFEPVQIQKLVFLIQDKASAYFTEPLFEFKPYDYGPFDATVYSCLENLASKGFVKIFGEPFDRRRLYLITEEGLRAGEEYLQSIPDPFRSLMINLAEWVRKLSFAQLVGAIYKEYPDMKSRSVFQE